MKRYLAVFLSIALLIGMLAGCSKKAPEETAPESTAAPASTQTAEAETARSRIVDVFNIDELLAAIAPDTEIRLASGTYLLTDAADYGICDSKYYRWENCYDGFELQLTEVQGLTIRGNTPEDTEIQALARYANVLTLDSCADVVLENLTMGHTKGIPGECSGGVLNLGGCDRITVKNCGLFGCGIVGVSAMYSDFVTVTDCEIYECSSTGINLQNCRDTLVKNTVIRDLGKTNGSYCAVSAYDCKRLSVNACDIRSNILNCMFSFGNSRDIVLTGNTLSGNNLTGSIFAASASDVIFDSNHVSGTVRYWYENSSDNVFDAKGNELDVAALNAMYPDCVPASTPAPTGGKKEVHVSTADEFLNAIDNDTVIIIDSKLIDFSTASGYGTQSGEHYWWVDNYDGPGLIISGVQNLTIRSSDGNTKGHTLSAVPRYSDVIFFQNCSFLTLSGFTAGHTQEPGYCMGGVFRFEQCDHVAFDHCGMYGCGILGITAVFSSDFTIEDCDIYECSDGGISMYNVQNVAINRCTFRDLGGSRLDFYECSGITEDGQTLTDGMYD